MQSVNMDMLNLAVLVCLCSASTVLSFGSYGDRCTLHVIPRVNEILDVNAKDDCEHGTIWWSYPVGGVRVHFHQSSVFSVCMIDYIGGAVLHLFDETSGQDKPLQQVSRDTNATDTCLSSRDGEVILKMQAPDLLMYMAAIDYVIHPENSS